MNKKIFGVVTTLCMCLSVVAGAANVSLRDAVRIARTQVPKGCHLQNVENYNGVIGVSFRNYNTLRNYTVFLEDEGGTPCERVMTGSNIVGSTNVLVDRTAITKAVFDRYKKVDNLKVELESEGKNNLRYRVEFLNERYIITALFNPATGALVKEHIIYRW